MRLLRLGHVLVRQLTAAVLNRPAHCARKAHKLGLAVLPGAVVLGVGVLAVSASWPAEAKLKEQAAQLAILTKQAVVKTLNRAAASAGLTPLVLRDISAAPVVSVSAASFEAAPVAPDSIVAAFGSGLATRTELASGDADPNTPGIQLPTQLAGTTVEVNGRRAGLFFVSPFQINYLIPDTTAGGTATVTVRSGDGTVSNGTVPIAQVAPGIFSANGNGRGVAAALALRVKGSGQQIYETIAQFNSTVNRMVTKPVDLQDDLVFLILYATGLRYVDNPAQDVSVLMGGIQLVPHAVIPVPGLAGLDQINVLIPRELIGRGIVSVSVAVAGFNSSNLVELEIAGNGAGPTAPQVSGFSVPQPISGQAVAGRMLIINGSGFSTDLTANKVYIGPSATEAQVMAATPTQLEVVVPYGVETGTIKVSTPLGEGVSTEIVPIVTSISGIVENTNRQPLSGVNVQIIGTEISAQTSNDGTFVLPNVLATSHTIQVDGDQIPTQPPYPKFTTKIIASPNRDNKFTRAIALQQATGSSGTVGGDSGAPATEDAGNLRLVDLAQQQPQPTTIAIQTGNFSLQVPATASANFPDHSKSGTIYLTPLQAGRTPVDLPGGIFSTSIVQITPFNVKLTPGAKLVFPNTDNIAPGTELKLYRYDPEALAERAFAPVEGATVTVSADGKSIETGQHDIQVTSYYFAATARPTTTVNGRVLCCVMDTGTSISNRLEPVSKAVVKLRGQEAATDGNGSYILRYVPVTPGENVAVDVTYIRPDGRVDRVQSQNAPVVLSGITKVADTLLPSASLNREPVILAPPKYEVASGQTTDIPLVIYDPDKGQQVTVSVTGANWASINRVQGNGTVVNANAYTLRVTPPERTSYRLTITATDGQGGTAVHNITIAVSDLNRPPTANGLDLVTDEDTPLVIKLVGSDPDGNTLQYKVLTMPVNGTLTGTAPNLTYTPAANFNGSDIFTFVVNDGNVNSLPATVKITVNPVNDPPVLDVVPTATVNEGQPLILNLNGSDVDQGQTLTITGTGLPAGATLSATSPTSAQFRWTPNFSQAGNYTLTFKATDNGTPPLSHSKEVKITVVDVPTFSVPGPQIINEGQQLIFDVAVPGGQTSSTVSASNLPAGATLTATSANVWQFKWTPSFTQAGVYTVSFRATSGNGSESKDVPITVFDTQRELSKEPGDLTVFGADGSASRNNLDASDALGTSVATGDLNGDGVADLVIGAPFANHGTEEAGKDTGSVYIFFGKASLVGTLDLAQQKPDVTLYGERAYDSFGASVAVGDISGDGKHDLIIGAPLADLNERRDCGKVYALFGAFPPEGLDNDNSAVITRLANLTISGADAGDKLGTSVAAGLIRSKIGALDLLASAPGVDVLPDNADIKQTDAGAVYLFAGGPDLSRGIDLAKVSATFTLVGETPNAQLGMSLAVGNFNGDDFADFAVGAPFEGVVIKEMGTAYLILGANGLTGTRAASARTTAFSVTGTRENDHFGAAVALGDINGDGFADLITGAPGGDGPLLSSRPDAGEVLVFFGTAGLQAKSMSIYGVGRREDAHPDALGSSLATGDFNGDGIADLVIGAPGADVSADKRDPLGAAYLIFGSRTGLPSAYDLATRAADLTIYGAQPGDRLGQGSFAFGKVNAADVPSLVLGIPRSASVNNTRNEAGEVRVLFGVRR